MNLLWNLNHSVSKYIRSLKEQQVSTTEENDAGQVNVRFSPRDCMRGMKDVILQVDDVFFYIFGVIQEHWNFIALHK